MERTVDLERVTYSKRMIRRFVWSNTTFQTPQSYEQNKCYFAEPIDQTIKDGVLYKPNICNSNVPVVYSNPHFLGSDQFYPDQVIGMNPNKLAHESFIDLQVETGNLIFERRNLQINFDTEVLSKVRNLKRYVFPVFWFCDNSYLDKKIYDDE